MDTSPDHDRRHNRRGSDDEEEEEETTRRGFQESKAEEPLKIVSSEKTGEEEQFAEAVVKKEEEEQAEEGGGGEEGDKDGEYGKTGRKRHPRPAPYPAGGPGSRRRESAGEGRDNETRTTWVPPPSRVNTLNPSLEFLPATAFTQFTKPLKVSSKSNVKKVAGSIAYTSRAGESPTLMGTGKESINQAIKALAIARDYLRDNNLDINAYPEFRSEEDEAISVVLTKTPLRKAPPVDDGSGAELRVAANSQPTEVAGSIAGKIRHGDRVAISCLGAASVNQTIKSIIFARRYLANEAIDICFRPEWVHINMNGEERSSLRFVIYAQQI
eukprot:gb/GEZN01012577.1/.p1 GENE.gb/GEZN01012577.1/~~gb/GEZN01012577.1/.p1  ORF type:complete len:327 (+),score=56.25 gb/GEZN01012577.1/:23-1003(+)